MSRTLVNVDCRTSPAEADVNVALGYMTFGGVQLVIATDDLDNARAALE